MKDQKSTTEKESLPEFLNHYKTPVKSAVGILLILLLLFEFVRKFKGNSELVEGIKNLAGEKSKCTVRREWRGRWPLYCVSEVAVKPEAGRQLDKARAVEHLERAFHQYTFKCIQQNRGGYDVFKAYQKI